MFPIFDSFVKLRIEPITDPLWFFKKTRKRSGESVEGAWYLSFAKALHCWLSQGCPSRGGGYALQIIHRVAGLVTGAVDNAERCEIICTGMGRVAWVDILSLCCIHSIRYHNWPKLTMMSWVPPCIKFQKPQVKLSHSDPCSEMDVSHLWRRSIFDSWCDGAYTQKTRHSALEIIVKSVEVRQLALLVV